MLHINIEHFLKIAAYMKEFPDAFSKNFALLALSAKSLRFSLFLQNFCTSHDFLKSLMSLCRILSTLCSQVVFHNIPQTAKERDKKYSVKSPQRYKK